MPEISLLTAIAERIGPAALVGLVMMLILRVQIVAILQSFVDYLKTVASGASKERSQANAAQDRIVADLVASYQQDFRESRAEMQRTVETARAAEMEARTEAASLRAELKAVLETVARLESEIAELKANMTTSEP